VLTSEVGTLATYGFMLAYALVSLAAPVFLFAGLSWPLWALPYVFLAWTAVGIVWYQVIRRTRPDVINSAGRWGELASLPEPARTSGAT
jgi:hypothetical protein